MEKKMTKREVLEAMLAGTLAHEDMVAFANHELDLLDRKAQSSKSESKITAEVKTEVLMALTEYEGAVALKTFRAEQFPEMTSQKLVPILKALETEGQVVRFTEKKVAMVKLNVA